MTPDVIADQALLTASRWQRDAMLNRILAAWWQGKDDGLPAEQRLNDNTDQYEARLDAVRGEMGREEILRKVNAPALPATRANEVLG
jgi:hypothetical protein